MAAPKPNAPRTVLVETPEEARSNLIRFAAEVAASAGLRARLGRVHAWYASRDDEGQWAFGSSKFLGYRDNTAGSYLEATRDGADGRETEPVLRQWFEVVDRDTPLGRELLRDLEAFLGGWHLKPRRGARISVLKTDLDTLPQTRRKPPTELAARISSDPAICSGRPCIRGTRMRVSDIVSMLASGASREEIVEDFPYLSEDDIAAALAFAAAAVDHRVIRAA